MSMISPPGAQSIIPPWYTPPSHTRTASTTSARGHRSHRQRETPPGQPAPGGVGEPCTAPCSLNRTATADFYARQHEARGPRPRHAPRPARPPLSQRARPHAANKSTATCMQPLACISGGGTGRETPHRMGLGLAPGGLRGEGTGDGTAHRRHRHRRLEEDRAVDDAASAQLQVLFTATLQTSSRLQCSPLVRRTWPNTATPTRAAGAAFGIL